MFIVVSRGCFCWVSYGIAEWQGCLVANLEYRLKRTITFYPTVGSCLNLYRGFQRLFFVGYTQNAFSVTRMSGRPNKSIGWKGPLLLVRQWDRAQIFTGVSRGCFRWVSYATAEWRGCLVANLEYRLKMDITFDPTVGSRSNFYSGFQRLFSLG
jgi:hypothetical protein